MYGAPASIVIGGPVVHVHPPVHNDIGAREDDVGHIAAQFPQFFRLEDRFERPVKHTPGMAAYRAAEQRLQTLIGQRFGVVFVAPLMHDIDNQMLMTERRDLMNTTPVWSVTCLSPYRGRIDPLPPNQAKRAFLDAAYGLLK